MYFNKNTQNNAPSKKVMEQRYDNLDTYNSITDIDTSDVEKLKDKIFYIKESNNYYRYTEEGEFIVVMDYEWTVSQIALIKLSMGQEITAIESEIFATKTLVNTTKTQLQDDINDTKNELENDINTKLDITQHNERVQDETIEFNTVKNRLTNLETDVVKKTYVDSKDTIINNTIQGLQLGLIQQRMYIDNEVTTQLENDIATKVSISDYEFDKVATQQAINTNTNKIEAIEQDYVTVEYLNNTILDRIQIDNIDDKLYVDTLVNQKVDNNEYNTAMNEINNFVNATSNTLYTLTNAVTILDNEKVDITDFDDYKEVITTDIEIANQDTVEYVDEQLLTKQDIIAAGANIVIENNEIKTANTIEITGSFVGSNLSANTATVTNILAAPKLNVYDETEGENNNIVLEAGAITFYEDGDVISTIDRNFKQEVITDTLALIPERQFNAVNGITVDTVEGTTTIAIDEDIVATKEYVDDRDLVKSVPITNRFIMNHGQNIDFIDYPDQVNYPNHMYLPDGYYVMKTMIASENGTPIDKCWTGTGGVTAGHQNYYYGSTVPSPGELIHDKCFKIVNIPEDTPYFYIESCVDGNGPIQYAYNPIDPIDGRIRAWFTGTGDTDDYKWCFRKDITKAYPAIYLSTKTEHSMMMMTSIEQSRFTHVLFDSDSTDAIFLNPVAASPAVNYTLTNNTTAYSFKSDGVLEVTNTVTNESNTIDLTTLNNSNALENKQDKLTAGANITIDVDSGATNVINTIQNIRTTDTPTFNNIVSTNAPTSANHVATKKYVDDRDLVKSSTITNKFIMHHGQNVNFIDYPDQVTYPNHVYLPDGYYVLKTMVASENGNPSAKCWSGTANITSPYQNSWYGSAVPLKGEVFGDRGFRITNIPGTPFFFLECWINANGELKKYFYQDYDPAVSARIRGTFSGFSESDNNQWRFMKDTTKPYTAVYLSTKKYHSMMNVTNAGASRFTHDLFDSSSTNTIFFNPVKASPVVNYKITNNTTVYDFRNDGFLTVTDTLSGLSNTIDMSILSSSGGGGTLPTNPSFNTVSLVSTPSANNHAINLSYLNTRLEPFEASGATNDLAQNGIPTFNNVLVNGQPSDNKHLTTKNYVDNRIATLPIENKIPGNFNENGMTYNFQPKFWNSTINQWIKLPAWAHSRFYIYGQICCYELALVNVAIPNGIGPTGNYYFKLQLPVHLNQYCDSVIACMGFIGTTEIKFVSVSQIDLSLDSVYLLKTANSSILSNYVTYSDVMGKNLSLRFCITYKIQ